MISIYCLFWISLFVSHVSSYKPDFAVKRQSKSIFSDKKYTETIIPARYKIGAPDRKYDRKSVPKTVIPKPYFPEVEYPTSIMEASKPFYFKTGENSEITPFPDDVKASFKALNAKLEIEKIKTDYYHTLADIIAGKHTENKDNNNLTDIDFTEANIEEILPELKAFLRDPSTEQITAADENLEDMDISESQESVDDIDYKAPVDFFENATTDLHTADIFEEQKDKSLDDNSNCSLSECENDDEIEPLLLECYNSSVSTESVLTPECPTLDVDSLLLEMTTNDRIERDIKKVASTPQQILKQKKMLPSKCKPTYLFR